MTLRIRPVLEKASSKVTSPRLSWAHSSSTRMLKMWPVRRNLADRRRTACSHFVPDGASSASFLLRVRDRWNELRSMPLPVSTSRSSSSVCTPTRAATKAPVAVPVMMRGSRPLKCSAFTTPMWHMLKAEPPCKTRVVRPKVWVVSWKSSILVWELKPAWVPEMAAK